jgi:ferredoxin
MKEYTTKEGKKIILDVDRDICIGAASCIAIAPLTFGIDDESKAYILNESIDDYETILEAAKSCPVSAIILKDENGEQIWP